MSYLTAPTKNIRGRSSRGRTSRRSRRQGGDSVGNYFGDAWSLAKRTANGLNEIRKLINVEIKYIQTDSTSTINNTGAVQYISNCAQGDDIINREGDSIKVQNFTIKGMIKRDPASTSNLEAVRLLVVRDLQNTGATPSANDVFQITGTGLAPYQPYDFLNGSDLNKRFSVVYDELFSLDTYHPNALFSFNSNHDCHVFYRDTAAAVASAGNGSYFLVALSNVTANLPSVEYVSVIRFTDN